MFYFILNFANLRFEIIDRHAFSVSAYMHK